MTKLDELRKIIHEELRGKSFTHRFFRDVDGNIPASLRKLYRNGELKRLAKSNRESVYEATTKLKVPAGTNLRTISPTAVPAWLRAWPNLRCSLRPEWVGAAPGCNLAGQ